MHLSLRGDARQAGLANGEAVGRSDHRLSFTRAAEELFVTQSAVSRQIQALEERLGVKLFAVADSAPGRVPQGASGRGCAHCGQQPGARSRPRAYQCGDPVLSGALRFSHYDQVIRAATWTTSSPG
jgi:Bacterial regulatory helix-turn-helix protein, lysR family